MELLSLIAVVMLLQPVIGSRITDTPLGQIEGITCDAYEDVTQFLGVPFAVPPLGELRYRPPILYSQSFPESGYKATSFPPPCGSICTLSSTPATDRGDSAITASEDCLYLNIWAPANATKDSKLPVRVYIHGGAVNLCSASDAHLLGCDAVKKTAMIQVNMQFRRGAFGFLAHPQTFNESSTTGNWAFLDQQMALHWVQKYIEYFGGDKTKVMLNGQSGGGQCVDLHQVAPASAGLFSSAISQSPPCVKVLSLEKAYEFSQQIMREVGCYPLASHAEQMRCMRSLSWDVLMNASRNLADDNFARLLMCKGADWYSFLHYTLDGHVFTSQVEEALVQGRFHRVPYMVGSNTNEGSYFEEDLVTDFNESAYEARVTLLQNLYPHVDIGTLLKLYAETMFPNDQNDTSLLLAHLWTDIFYTCPIHKRLVARAKADPRNIYLYNWNVTMDCPLETEYLGATHTAELRASFGITTNIPTTETASGFCNYTQEETWFSDVLLLGWKTMADEGVPRWESGRSWPQWVDPNEYGVFLSKERTQVGKLNPGRRCLVIDDVLKMSKESLPTIKTNFASDVFGSKTVQKSGDR